MDKGITNKYIDYLKNLPEKNRYTINDLLVDDLLIDYEKNFKIYYSPFDFINMNAKLIIVGITPGFTQMEIAVRYFKKEMLLKKSINEILENVRKEAAFAGTMRKNLINMLDQINVNTIFGINSCNLLFENINFELIHATSLIRYPVYNEGKNYTGYSPDILSSDLLRKYVLDNFLEEIKKINFSLIIPLGTSVSKVLKWISKYHFNIEEKCLFEFPHPSGANGHRLKIFNEKKDDYINIIKNIKKSNNVT